MKKFYEITGAVLLVLCFVALIVSFVFASTVIKKTKTEQIKVELVLPVDTTGVLNQHGREKADSVIWALQKYQHQLDDKYQYVLEQKGAFNDLITIAGMILAVVISLFGFFGYKSINSIENKVKREAVSTAKATAETVSQNKFKVYEKKTTEKLQNEIITAVDETIKKNLAEYKKATKEQLEDSMRQQIKSETQKLSDFEDILSGLTDSVGNLDQKLVRLGERIGRVEAKSGVEDSGRRTIKDEEEQK